MTRYRPTTVFIAAMMTFACFRLFGTSVLGQEQGLRQVIGTWKGTSVCVDKTNFPACNDETVIYHIVQSASAANVLTIKMDKLVDGKPELMAELDFSYDGAKGTLTSEFSRNSRRGIWEFTVKESSMEGTLTTLPDKLVARRIKVEKVKK